MSWRPLAIRSAKGEHISERVRKNKRRGAIKAFCCPPTLTLSPLRARVCGYMSEVPLVVAVKKYTRASAKTRHCHACLYLFDYCIYYERSPTVIGCSATVCAKEPLDACSSNLFSVREISLTVSIRSTTEYGKRTRIIYSESERCRCRSHHAALGAGALSSRCFSLVRLYLVFFSFSRSVYVPRAAWSCLSVDWRCRRRRNVYVQVHCRLCVQNVGREAPGISRMQFSACQWISLISRRYRCSSKWWCLAKLLWNCVLETMEREESWIFLLCLTRVIAVLITKIWF